MKKIAGKKMSIPAKSVPGIWQVKWLFPQIFFIILRIKIGFSLAHVLFLLFVNIDLVSVLCLCHIVCPQLFRFSVRKSPETLYCAKYSQYITFWNVTLFIWYLKICSFSSLTNMNSCRTKKGQSGGTRTWPKTRSLYHYSWLRWQVSHLACLCVLVKCCSPYHYKPRSFFISFYTQCFK